MFVLGRDDRFSLDGSFYGLRELAEQIAGHRLPSLHPRPEDYPRDWLQRGTRGAHARPVPAGAPPAGDSPDRWVTPEQVRAERTQIWELVQDRASRPVGRPT